LVVDHFFHDEVAAMVAKIGPTTADFIGTWQSSVSRVMDRLEGEKKLSEYTLVADNWNKHGPPKEIQMR